MGFCITTTTLQKSCFLLQLSEVLLINISTSALPTFAEFPCLLHFVSFQCSDGIDGNGNCQCFEGFKGIACHICSNPNKHGENCDEGW